MRLSEESLTSLGRVISELYEVELSDEETQIAGIAILRLVALRQMQKVDTNQKNKIEEKVYDKFVYNK
jgi:hypothetical protein